jgi:hypothetical protein
MLVKLTSRGIPIKSIRFKTRWLLEYMMECNELSAYLVLNDWISFIGLTRDSRIFWYKREEESKDERPFSLFIYWQSWEKQTDVEWINFNTLAALLISPFFSHSHNPINNLVLKTFWIPRQMRFLNLDRNNTIVTKLK